MGTAAAYEYTFRPLAVTERVVKESHTQMLLVARLVPDNASQRPRIYMVWLENDFTYVDPNPRSFWGGIPMWLWLHLQAVIKENGTVKITFGGPIEKIEQNENDNVYDMYTYAPRWLNFLKEIKIVNKDDPTNYYSFRLGTPTKSSAEFPEPLSDSVAEKIARLPIVENSGEVRPTIFTSFTREDLTYRSEDKTKIYGNWSTSFSGACAGGANYSFIEAGAVVSMNYQANPCGNGSRVIKWEYN